MSSGPARKPSWSPADCGDRQLIESLLNGQQEAIEEVRRWVRGGSGPYRRLLANDLEDLEQEVLISLLATLRDGRFSGDSRLATYVRRAVHYKCIDRIRAARRREWINVEGLEFESTDATPLEDAATHQSVEIALEVVSRMPDDCRRLWSWIQQGLSYGEMSERLGIAAGTLRVRVLRCRRKALDERQRILTSRVRSNGSAAPSTGDMETVR